MTSDQQPLTSHDAPLRWKSVIRARGDLCGLKLSPGQPLLSPHLASLRRRAHLFFVSQKGLHFLAGFTTRKYHQDSAALTCTIIIPSGEVSCVTLCIYLFTIPLMYILVAAVYVILTHQEEQRRGSAQWTNRGELLVKVRCQCWGEDLGSQHLM
jgi:hypothetical protein